MQNEAYPHLFYIPKEEHPFRCALIGSGRLLITLSEDEGEDEASMWAYFLEINIAGNLKRTMVEWYYNRRQWEQFVYSPYQGSDFPIYGVHAAGQLYAKYLPHMVADQF